MSSKTIASFGLKIEVHDDVPSDTIIISKTNYAEILAGGERARNQLAVFDRALSLLTPNNRS